MFEMLFDTWDRHRGLRQSFDFEAHVEPALMHLAYCIYSDYNLQNGVTESRLVKETSDYLKKWQYEDRQKAIHAAQSFVSFCRGRAWVLTEVGFNENSEPIFKFTHRTFLEYFTAAHLARVAPSIEMLIQYLIAHIGMNEWDVVAQLAIQLKARSIHGGSDAAANTLLSYASDANNCLTTRVNVGSFLVRSMSFLATSPPATHRLVYELFRLCSNHYAASVEKVLRGTSEDATTCIGVVPTVFEGLPKVAREIRELMANSLVDSIMDHLSSADGPDLEMACSITQRLDSIFEWSPNVSELQARLSALAGPILDANINHWPWAPVSMYYDNSVTESRLHKWQVSELLIVDAGPMPGFPHLYCPPGIFAARCAITERCDLAHRPFDELLSLITHWVKQIVRGARFPVVAGSTGKNFDALMGDDLAANYHQRVEAHSHRSLTDEELLDISLLFAVANEYFEYTGKASYGNGSARMTRLASLEPILAPRWGRSFPRSLQLSSSGTLLVKWVNYEEQFWVHQEV